MKKMSAVFSGQKKERKNKGLNATNNISDDFANNIIGQFQIFKIHTWL